MADDIEKEPTFEDILEEAKTKLRDELGDTFDALDVYIESKLKALHDRVKGK